MPEAAARDAGERHPGQRVSHAFAPLPAQQPCYSLAVHTDLASAAPPADTQQRGLRIAGAREKALGRWGEQREERHP